MKTQNSPLQCQGSLLHSLSIKQFVPKRAIEHFSMTDYAIDLHFDVLEDVDDTHEFIVRLDVAINNKGKKIPGYVMALKVDYHFQLNDNALGKDAINGLKTLSAVSIAIAKLRADLERITQPYQFGTYSLPLIDMQDLFAKKQALIDAQEQ